MSKIDVSMCEFCNTEDYEVPVCQQKKYRNEVEIPCEEMKDCHYKQLQQLKAENQNLKQECDLYKTWYRVKQLCLYEIEEIVQKYDINNPNTIISNPLEELCQILLKIKEVKGE